MARHVQNAVDAGEGDLEAKNLRQRVAANPGDLNARILLAQFEKTLKDAGLEPGPDDKSEFDWLTKRLA